MNSKDWKFHKRFDLPPDEQLLEVYGCTVNTVPPRVGNLFLSNNHLCFYSNILSAKTKRKLRLADIIEVKKTRLYGIKVVFLDNGKREKFGFSNFPKLEDAYNTIVLHWTMERTKNNSSSSSSWSSASPSPSAGSSMPVRQLLGSESYGVLFVTLVESKYLPRNIKGAPSCYCTLAFNGRHFQTDVAAPSNSPKWSQRFSLPITRADKDNGELLISVYDATPLQATGGGEEEGLHNLVGVHMLPLAPCLKSKHMSMPSPSASSPPTARTKPIHDRWLILDTEHSKGFLKDKNDNHAQVHVITEFVLKEDIQREFWVECAKLFDLDGDGEIDRFEVTRMLEALGSGMEEEDIDRLFSTIDINKDGKLSAEELIFFTNQNQSSFLLKKCPICTVSLPSNDDEIIFHLGTCLHDNPAALRNTVLSGLVTPLGKVKKLLPKMKHKDGRLLVLERHSGVLVEEKIPPYIKMALNAMYGNKLATKALGGKSAHKVLHQMTVNQGEKYDHPASGKDIRPFIEFHELNEEEILDPISSFKNFNEFFYRKLKPGARPIFAPNDPTIAVSPADCRSMFFPNISEATRLWIKGKNFSVASLLKNAPLAHKFSGGSLAIFRLAPQDYHRYHMPVKGRVGNTYHIAGKYYTVNPIAVNLKDVNVYGENKRCVTEIHSPDFGSVLYVSIGATLVGSICLTSNPGQLVNKGDEHGYFAFGGSTIVLLFQPHAITFDDDLLRNSAQPVETLIKVGDRIGRAVRSNSGSSPSSSLASSSPSSFSSSSAASTTTTASCDSSNNYNSNNNTATSTDLYAKFAQMREEQIKEQQRMQDERRRAIELQMQNMHLNNNVPIGRQTSSTAPFQNRPHSAPGDLGATTSPSKQSLSSVMVGPARAPHLPAYPAPPSALSFTSSAAASFSSSPPPSYISSSPSASPSLPYQQQLQPQHQQQYAPSFHPQHSSSPSPSFPSSSPPPSFQPSYYPPSVAQQQHLHQQTNFYHHQQHVHHHASSPVAPPTGWSHNNFNSVHQAQHPPSYSPSYSPHPASPPSFSGPSPSFNSNSNSGYYPPTMPPSTQEGPTLHFPSPYQ